MVPVDVEFHLLRKPFVPFRIVMADGITYDIHRSELVMLGEASLLIGIPPVPGGRYFMRFVSLFLAFVVRIDLIEHPTEETTQKNG
jgi:hypothetical protein